MSCMLHTLSSTFTTCACGSKSKDCVLRLMEAFVDFELPPKPLNTHIDLGPLIGHRRGFRTQEKVPFSGGLTGVEMVNLEPMSRATSLLSTDSEPHGPLDSDVKPQLTVISTPNHFQHPLIAYQTWPSCLHHLGPHAASQGRQRKHKLLHPPHLSLHHLHILLNYLYCHLPSKMSLEVVSSSFNDRPHSTIPSSPTPSTPTLDDVHFPRTFVFLPCSLSSTPSTLCV